MVDRFTNLVSHLSRTLDFGQNRAEGDDLLGDAYEYLMRHFATESARARASFTPRRRSRASWPRSSASAARPAPARPSTIPPAAPVRCCSRPTTRPRARRGCDLALYGQEMDNATKALARMNMILHDCPTAEIWQDNTLSTRISRSQDGALKTFDFAVANPPVLHQGVEQRLRSGQRPLWSLRLWHPAGKRMATTPSCCTSSLPRSKAVAKARSFSRMACCSGAARGAIRREPRPRGYIKGIIGLPANLFYGTGIPACIIVLDKENAAPARASS
jgi:type I restriction enzyme M protein